TQCDYTWFWMSSDSLAMHFGYYDETVRTHDASLLKMNEVLARYAQITSHDHILDAGCGVGGSAIWLARIFGCQVKGITIVPEQGRPFAGERVLVTREPSAFSRRTCGARALVRRMGDARSAHAGRLWQAVRTQRVPVHPNLRLD